MKQLLFLRLFFLLSPLSALAQPAWKPVKTAVTFTIRNAGFNVDGNFSGFAGQLLFDPAAPNKAQLTATIETATLSTGNSLRDGHLKKPDYFDVATYPRISLKSVRIVKSSTNAYVGTFDLTIKTTTKPVQIPFTFTHSGTTGTFAGSFLIDRIQYGVGKKSFLLSNDVRIDLKIDVQSAGVTASN